MIRVICDLLFELVCLIGLIVAKYTDEITFYQFIVGMMIYYGLTRFLSVTNEFTIEEIKDNE